ncbi:MAG TPA: hypothetical protein VFQ61_33635, partial [Polyangiaceae bacterium]|nr:hypothetical protein [Polyangiaceae bacterium]
MEEVASAASLSRSEARFENANTGGSLAWYKVRVSPRVWSAFALIFCALFLAWHARRYLPFMADDAFISLRYSQRLIEGKGLTWDSSEHVEGYSNLTWVLACAVLGALGTDWVLAARIVGAVSSFALLAAIAYAFRPGRGGGFWCATAAMLSVAVCTPIAVWAQGGLEQPLVAALLAWSFALTLYRGDPARVSLRAPALLLALLTLSRPDGVFLAALFSAGVGVSRGLHWAQLRRGAVLFTGAGIASLLQLAFRWFYYHDWVPNPARIKVSFTPERLKEGLEYLNQALLFLSPAGIAILAAVTALSARAEARIRALPIGMLALCWAAYVAFIGGDIFPGRRHVVVLIVAAAFALGELLFWMKRELSGRAPVFGIALAFVLVQATIQINDPEAKAAQEEKWEWDGEVVGRLLKQAFARQSPL